MSAERTIKRKRSTDIIKYRGFRENRAKAGVLELGHGRNFDAHGEDDHVFHNQTDSMGGEEAIYL